MVLIYRTALRLMGRHAWVTPAVGSDPLRDMATDVSRRWSNVPHLTTVDVAAQLSSRQNRIVLFDVREPEEFAVSRLRGARSLPPHSRKAPLQEAIGLCPPVELVVFYCAVGVRSSAMANRWHQEADDRDILVANLAGGLFRWANEGRPLVNDQGVTTAVHPFNRHWSQFLVSKDDR